MPEISMKKHLWCHLEYEGHRIAAHFSAWSGKEIIYLDDHPVSEVRNLTSFTGTHPIKIEDVQYMVELEIENPFTLKVELRLKKGARTVARANKRFLKINKKTILSLLGFFAVAMTVGYTLGYFIPKLFIG